MDLEHIVIENIKRIRKQKHITQEKLAEYCETSVSYIGLMETYKNIPKLSTIERIAQALNVPVLELFTSPEASAKEKGSKKNSKSQKENDKEKAQKQKLRNRIKKEILEETGKTLDNILKII